MGLKADTSFLRFVTMGAVGTREVMNHLRSLGFQPIELERYSTTNKIWATKVKRLRLPDILCIKTGIRFEARAKSDLAIKMSHSPNNAERAWDAGLRPSDLIAFAQVAEVGGVMQVAVPQYFRVADLQATFATAKLGPMKAQSEGAEQDVVWPSWVPTASGVVRSVDNGKVGLDKTGGGKQTYTLGAKHLYGGVGTSFDGDKTILAGSPATKVDPASLVGTTWNPTTLLSSADAVDRYAAIRALAHATPPAPAIALIKGRMPNETDARTKLECAASLARLGDDDGYVALQDAINSPALPFLRMEAIIILTELGKARSKDLLLAAANRPDFVGKEERQAAVWGLGAAGCKANDELLPFIDDGDEDVALHAVAAFSGPFTSAVRDALMNDLFTAGPRRANAARDVLARYGGGTEISTLASAVADAARRERALAALGAFGRDRLVAANVATQILTDLAPLFALIDERENWLASNTVAADLRYLLAQRL